MIKRPKVAVLVQRVGAYHRARLAALAEQADVLAVETCAVDATYRWARNEGEGDGFARTTMFATDEDAADIAALSYKLNNVLQQYSPDVVAVPGWSDPAALLGLAFASRARTRTGARVIRILMSDSQAIDAPRRFLNETVKRAVVSFADAGLVAGRTHAEYLAKLGLPRRHIALGYDVVDNAHFSAGAEAARRDPLAASSLGLDFPFFLAVARFVAKKNLVTLVAAHGRYCREARVMGRSPWRLVLVGDGPERNTIAAAAEAGGEDVELRQFATYAALPEFYALARALVLPSTVEQWGLVVNEAMAAGCPVLVSHLAGAAAELIDDGVNGLITAPDEASLAASLARMERADHFRLAAAGRETIASWGPERFANGLLTAAEKARIGRKSLVPSDFLALLATRTRRIQEV